MIGKLNEQQMEDLLKRQVVGRIGCYADGRTYVVPISYAYDGNFIYANTHEGLKLKIMRENPMVCFEVDELRDLANWKSVIAWGEFQELTEQDEREEGLKKLLDRMLPFVTSQTMHLSADSPFRPENINTISGVVFRIRVHHKTGRYEINSVNVPYP